MKEGVSERPHAAQSPVDAADSFPHEGHSAMAAERRWRSRRIGEVAEPISRDAAAHVAKLARLDLTDDELERFTGQLGAVLEHAADIAALDIADGPPTAHPWPLANGLRAAEPPPSLCPDGVLGQPPAPGDGRFEV